MAENKNRRPNQGPNRGPMGRGIGMVEKPKDFKGTVKKLISYVKVHKIGLSIVLICAMFSTLFSIYGPKILGNATTELFTGLMGRVTGGAGINFDKIASILLWTLALYIVGTLFSYIQGFVMTNISQKVTYKLRKDVSEKISKMPMNYFDKKTNGETLSVITNDIDTLSQSLNQSLTQIITSIVSIIGILIMMFSINFTLTLICLIILPISIGLLGFIMGKSQKYFQDLQNNIAKMSGDVEEMYGGHNVIKVFNAEKKQLDKFKETNEIVRNNALKGTFYSGLMQPIMNFVNNLGYVCVAIVGGYYAMIGKITVGNIQSFIQYNRNFTQNISSVAQQSNTLQSMIAAAERVFEFLNEDEESLEVASPEDASNIIGAVDFKNVKFGYDKEKPVIHDFTAHVAPGQKIAIVGPTGAGKTTMVKLLMRFYNIDAGEILIDGKNINNFNRSDLRHIFGMVLQDTWLFHGTIMENLRYGKLDATDEEVLKAAKTANIDHFVKTLSDGYNMMINEEANNISAGQKQLLTIARAILADPKVLILDEATSNVDTRTEVLIQKAMDELMKGRTSFIIAHRLSTIKNADLILVMDQGDIVEQGTHDELLNKNGFYANLYNSQFEEIE